jgi:hypothetical protein
MQIIWRVYGAAATPAQNPCGIKTFPLSGTKKPPEYGGFF